MPQDSIRPNLLTLKERKPMPSLYILIPVAMIFSALAIGIFIWALNNNQYNDLDKEANRILFDEDINDRPLTRDTEKNSNE